MSNHQRHERLKGQWAYIHACIGASSGTARVIKSECNNTANADKIVPEVTVANTSITDMWLVCGQWCLLDTGGGDDE